MVGTTICKYFNGCNNNDYIMTYKDCPVRYKEMEFVIPDESFDNSNDPLRVQSLLFYMWYNIIIMYIVHSHRQAR